MDKVSTGKMHTLSITIQWREGETELAEGTSNDSNFDKTTQSQRFIAGLDYGDAKRNSIYHAGATRSSKRLLPSDRVVLNALRARVPKGAQVTTLVRMRELQAECEISRRQVQICLKRLNEKGLIKRLHEEVTGGSQEGYHYQLSKDVLSR
jgi:hypothetical protein